MGTLGVIGGSIGGAGAASDPLTLVQHSASVTVTAHATAHTKGAWTELIASTSGDATFLVLDVSGVAVSATSTATLIDLAVGGAGSEVAFLSNLPVGGADAAVSGISCYQVPLPVSVASGSRISARIQSEVAGGKTASVAVAAFSGGALTPGTLTVLGSSTGTSRGTALDTSRVEIVASTAATYRYLVMVPSLAASIVSTDTTMSVGLASGGAGSEVSIGSISARLRYLEQIGVPAGRVSWAMTAVKGGVSAGTRLSMNQSSMSGAVIDGAIIGVT